ncbi:MAG: glycosyltransferase family protein [Bacteroidota bacterium]
MPNIVTIIQARLGSSRLPGKVIKPILDEPLLYRMIERVSHSHIAGTIVLATTSKDKDDLIAKMGMAYGWNVYRGDEEDLLDRHYQAAKMHDADIVLKIPSDCPLIDPQIIDRCIQSFLDHPCDYLSNLHPATYPDGNDVEIMSMSVLKEAWIKADRDYEREHTTPFFWERPGQFHIRNITWELGKDYSMSHRWTIDYEEDYHFIRRVYEELYESNPAFTIHDILDLLERKPEIADVNQKFAGVNWYRHHLDDLKTVDPSQTKTIA